MWRLSLVGLAACVASGTVICPSGLVCPPDTECRAVSGAETCATQAQLDACASKANLESCDGNDPRKRCLDGVCLDACGNGRDDPGETCDDGNTVAGDGCSATCIIEQCGTGEIDLVLGEECDDGLAGVSGDGCSSTCRLERPEWSELEQPTLPGRSEHAMAYFADPARSIAPELVMFGGINDEGILGDTWRWYDDGTGGGSAWHEQFPPRAPSARHGHAMSWDPVRKRVLLFGGTSAAGLLADTWEWDGELWTELTPPSVPTPVTNPGLAYDPARARTVLFGGNRPDGPLNVLYEWNGTTWTNISALTTYPPANTHVALAYDTARSEMIYCGAPESPSTWKYDGAWTNLNVACPTSGSFPNAPSAMAFDPTAGRLVLTQGNGNVWEWDGANKQWVSQPTLSLPVYGTAMAYDGTYVIILGGHNNGLWSTGAFHKQMWRRKDVTGTYKFYELYPAETNPIERYGGGVAFDTKRKRGVIVGGSIFTGTTNGDTWVFDDHRWHQIGGPVASFSGRRQMAVGYDAARDVVVMFGGTTSIPAPPSQPTTVLAETWEMAPTGMWIQRTFATKPSPRRGAAMAYDSGRKEFVLFGGDDGTGTRLDDTWVYDGSAWALVDVPATLRPKARSTAAMGYDPERERVVMFSGSDGLAGYVGDTWEWDGTTRIWSRLQSDDTSTGGPAARGEASLVYDPLRRRLVLLGGGAVNLNGSHDSDVWEWDGTSWEQKNEDARLARVGAFAFFDPLRGGIVSYGGELSSGGGYSDKTWLLRYESLATRETCRFADDDLDGDGSHGCADPDCEPRCFACGNGMCEPYEDRLICPADCN